VRGYEALGVELHSMDARDGAEDFGSTFRLGRPLPPVSPPVRAQPQRNAPPESSRRSAAGLGGSLRAASALALDLGEDAPRESRFGGSSLAAGNPSSMAGGSPSSSKAWRSTSLGTLQVTKGAHQAAPTFEARPMRKAAGLLPTLPGYSAGGSVAWSIRTARRGPNRQRSVGAIS